MRSNQLSYLAIGTQWGPVAPAVRAPKGNRTLDLLLTMETLCLLSYRGNAGKLIPTLAAEAIPEPEKDLTGVSRWNQRVVAGEGFEPPKHEASDLQSDPFGRFGNLPCAALAVP